MPMCAYHESNHTCLEEAWEGSAKGYCLYHSEENGRDNETAAKVWEAARERAGTNPVYTGWRFPQEPNGAGFDGTTFAGDAGFDGATFTGDAGFDGATFTGVAVFMHATFNRSARFDRATFNRSARFDRATFNHSARFERATFNRSARFEGATFTMEALFTGATVRAQCSFQGASIRSKILFDNASLLDVLSLENASVIGAAIFDGTAVKGMAICNNCTFSGIASFRRVEITGLSHFSNSSFQRGADFRGAAFNTDVSFSGATFISTISFTQALFAGKADFNDLILYPGASIEIDLPRLLPASTPNFRVPRESVGLYRHAQTAAHARGDPDAARLFSFAWRFAKTLSVESGGGGGSGCVAFTNRLALCGFFVIGAWPWLVLVMGLAVVSVFACAYWVGQGILDTSAARCECTNHPPPYLWGENSRKSIGVTTTRDVSAGALPLMASVRQQDRPSWWQCCHFSALTFTTLGYGDFVPKPRFRLCADLESGVGAVLIALYVTMLARKHMS